MNRSSLRILYGYPYYPSEAYGDTQQMALAQVKRYQDVGYDIEPFCLTLNPPGPYLPFHELDARWKRGERTLLEMYERLLGALEGKNVLINAAGINLHPEFVDALPVFRVFQCFDDPESSEFLSRPVAAAYDLCLVGNIAEVSTYRTWGVRQAEWIPQGLQPGLYDPSLTEEDILNGQRDIDLFMMIDRMSPYRKARLDVLANAFPQGYFFGRGWSRGFLPESEQLNYLRRAKIGPNLHNSTGPINLRTFYLPANGVMQICDNKQNLGKIYVLGKEAAGFDTVQECIDLCRYYLAHDLERRQIAADGWKRTMKDYTEEAVFARTVNLIKSCLPVFAAPVRDTGIVIRQRAKTRFRRLIYPFQRVVRALWRRRNLLK